MTINEAALAVKEAHERWVSTGDELARLQNQVQVAQDVQLDAARECNEAVKELSKALGVPLFHKFAS